MSEQSGFFDAHLIDGTYDRVYLAESFAKYFASFIGNGIFGGKSNELMVQQKTTANMSVRVLSGQGWINGYWYENDSELSLAIDAADGVLNRIDIIVLRWSKSDRAIRLIVKKGTPASSPSAPSITRGSDFYELKLAEVYVKAGATIITQTNITDTRLNASVCGLVQGVVKQFDTTEFGKQIDSFIEEFEVSNIVKMNEVLAKLNKIAEANSLASLIFDVDALDASTLQFQTNTLDGSTDFNSITTRGIYWCDTWEGTGGFNLPNGQDSGWLVVYADPNNANGVIVQDYYSNMGVRLKRVRPIDGTISSWAWENPPAIPGIEYRTMERFNGKPVYQFVLLDPTLPAVASGETIETGLNIVSIVSVTGFVKHKVSGNVYPIPVFFDGEAVPSLLINKVTTNGAISFTTTKSMSNFEMYVTIKYTKT